MFGVIRKYVVAVAFSTVCVSLFVSCGNPRRKCVKNKIKSGEFPYVEVPALIVGDSARAAFAAENFWNNYMASDGAEKVSAGNLGAAYNEYLKTLVFLYSINAPYDSIYNSLYRLFSEFDAKCTGDSTVKDRENWKKEFFAMIKFSEMWLYGANSAIRNDELYIPVLKAVINSGTLSHDEKLQYRYQLKIASLNRMGKKASDFDFEYVCEPSDMGSEKLVLKRGSLYSLRADYIMIYFNNPDCNACRENLKILGGDDEIKKMVSSGNLKILSMYIDKDIDLWKKHYDEFPSGWIYAYDPKFVLRNNNIYGLKAIPSIYLLDGDMHVIVKDAEAAQCIYFLKNMESRAGR